MHNLANSFPVNIRCFVDEETWTYAKTMPEWPHEYLVRERVDEDLFERMVRHIRANGYEKGVSIARRLSIMKKKGCYTGQWEPQ